jgi:hypothetical protein
MSGELNKKIWFLDIGIVVVLGVIAVIYYSYTQAVGLRQCAGDGVTLDQALTQQMESGPNGYHLSNTSYNFKDNTCYQDVVYTDTLGEFSQVHMYIDNAYTHQTISSCDINSTATNTESAYYCPQYYSDFNRIFYHLY